MTAPPLFAAGYSSLPARALDDDEVYSLVARAATANRRNDVTGQLLLVEEGPRVVRYVQWIEGPREAVLDLLVQISNDARHYDLRLSHVGPVDARRYPAWSMRERRVPSVALDRARLWTPDAPNLPVTDAVFDVLD